MAGTPGPRCGRCGFLESYASGEPDGYEAAQKKAVAWVVAICVAAAMALILIATYLGARGH